MFSSNIGFRRRTVSEGYSQLLPPLSSSDKRSSSTSHRHSLDELSSSSTTIKRVVLRKHSGDPTGSRGLADRIARSEVENINGFWSRRISGQRRSYPCSMKQVEPDIAEWRREARGDNETVSNTPGRSQTSSKPRGPRPLSKVSVTSHTQRSSYLIPSGMLSPSSSYTPGRAAEPSSMVSVDSAIRTEIVIPSHSSAVSSQALTKSRGSNTSMTDRAKDPGFIYRPLLPPGLPVTKATSDSMETKPKEQDKPATKEREKERRRFALELAFSRLIGGKKTSSNRTQPQNPSTALTIYNEKKHLPLLPPLVLPSSITLPPIPPIHPYSHIPIPPIPDCDAQVSRSRPRSIRSIRSVKSNKSAKSSKSSKDKVKRKSSSRSRKRKTGLARIVVELARGEKIVAMDAEAIQEAAQVRDVLEQLRQMKAS
ncbi:hypothetical protein A7U60_g2257 [Sanghuangporus baumii]|uniref:Uncharacterized protein n=1 Tax=Sanghuangporus baumii TaxID=108892 RepID=A0A9Q5I2K4_SANBA|nr:hypothetical protein A7U60_g2257 [Sanghuangporus baumii]